MYILKTQCKTQQPFDTINYITEYLPSKSTLHSSQTLTGFAEDGSATELSEQA